jgi:hypothetical protein
MNEGRLAANDDWRRSPVPGRPEPGDPVATSPARRGDVRGHPACPGGLTALSDSRPSPVRSGLSGRAGNQWMRSSRKPVRSPRAGILRPRGGRYSLVSSKSRARNAVSGMIPVMALRRPSRTVASDGSTGCSWPGRLPRRVAYSRRRRVEGGPSRRGGRVVDGSGLENRQAQASWVRIPPSPPGWQSLGYVAPGRP